MSEVFISGICPQSGKTLVSAGLTATMQSLSYSSAVFKPIQTGALVLNGEKLPYDMTFVEGIDSGIKTYSKYLLNGFESPFVSSYHEGVNIDLFEIKNKIFEMKNSVECSIVEGCNSISAPIIKSYTEADVVSFLAMPLVLVANPKKSPIDSVIASVDYAKSKNVNLLGIIVNCYDENSKSLEEKYYPQIIKEYSHVRILGCLPNYEMISMVNANDLISDILNKIDLESVFGLKIGKLS